jgi:hypothetical protein
MSTAMSAIDIYISAARALCARPSLAGAVRFWDAERRVHKAAGDLPWAIARGLLIERHGPDAIAVIAKAGQLRAGLLATPVTPPGGGTGVAGAKRHARVPVSSR